MKPLRPMRAHFCRLIYQLLVVCIQLRDLIQSKILTNSLKTEFQSCSWPSLVAKAQKSSALLFSNWEIQSWLHKLKRGSSMLKTGQTYRHHHAKHYSPHSFGSLLHSDVGPECLFHNGLKNLKKRRKTFISLIDTIVNSQTKRGI